MLYVSGSSGGQFDERARQLQGSWDVVAAIVEDVQAPRKTARQQAQPWAVALGVWRSWNHNGLTFKRRWAILGSLLACDSVFAGDLSRSVL